LPQLRRLLRVLQGVATLHAGGRCRARADSQPIRRRAARAHALRRGALLGPGRRGRRVHVLPDLRCAAACVPRLRARRRCLSHGAGPLRARA